MTDTRIFTDHVQYDPARAAEWLDSVAISHENVPGSTADSLGLDDNWPAGGDDDRLTNVVDLVDRALDEDVILLVGPTSDVDLIQTRDRYGVLTGARLLVETHGGVTLANDSALWTDDFTDGKSGRDGALAALAAAAHVTDALVSNYRRAEGA